MEERLQAEWTNHLPDQAEKEQAISKLATQVEEQVGARFVRRAERRMSHSIRVDRVISEYFHSLSYKRYQNSPLISVEPNRNAAFRV